MRVCAHLAPTGRHATIVHMKRLVTFIAALLCICAIAFASTSLATIGAVIPLSLYSGELESQTIDISDYDVPVQIAIPIILADSSLELTDILSSDPQTLLWALVEASSLFATVEDLWTVAGSGQVTISPSLEKLGEGTISCTIDYDDVLVMYQSAGVTDIGSIDGSATLSLDFMTDGLATLTVEADTSLAPASVITLTVRLDESALSSYMKLRGMDIEMVRYMLLGMLLPEIPSDIVAEVLGADPASLDASTVISLLDQGEMLDLFDAMIFLAVASEDYDLSESDLLTLVFQPEISIDGQKLDVDLQGLMKDLVRISNAF